MKTRVKVRRVLKVICLLVLFAAIGIGKAAAATYYMAPNGSDGGSGSTGSPWATFDKAMTVLRSGDTLLLKDGTYYQPMDVTVSGTAGKPITIKAAGDGKVTIDGQSGMTPLTIHGSSTSHIHNVTIEGLVLRNSSGHVVDIAYTDYITLRRVSAYGADYNSNSHVFSLVWSTHSLLEDCAASGYGRAMYDIYESDYTTLRRCWGRWTGHSYTGGDTGGLVQIYGTSNSIVENFIGTKLASWAGPVDGIGPWANYYNSGANYNSFYGNVIIGINTVAFYDSSSKYNIRGNRFRDDVSINTPSGFQQEGDDDLQITNMTIVNATHAGVTIQRNSYAPKKADFVMRGLLKNSSLFIAKIGIVVNDNASQPHSFLHTSNNFYNVGTAYYRTSPGAGEASVNPNYNTPGYGNGAYLMVPPALRKIGEGGADLGAEVLYRYRDGVLTSEPLWPWPMESRIFAETGVSVTWEKKGGLWKTLDGVYPKSSLPN